ncbi:MAG: hypothetical protein Q9187_000384 [Circinaria calcarea]
MTAEHIPLSPLDNVMARYYAKFILCIPTKPDHKPEVVYEYMQEALAKTVVEIPFLAGKLGVRALDAPESKPGQLEMRVPTCLDTESMPCLRYKDMTATMNYEDLMDAGLPEAELDGELLLPAAFRPNLAMGTDILVTQANFIDGGCLLGVGIWHSVTDGSGLNTIMKVWADHCQRLQKQESSTPLLDIPAESFDRELLTKLWLAEGGARTPEYLDNSEPQWRLLGLNPVANMITTPDSFAPEAPSSAFSGNAPLMETSIFYVSATSFADLKHECSHEGHGISANDALMALLWKCIMSARFPPGQSIGTNEETAILDTTIDGRAQFSTELPPSYLGNVILIGTTFLPLSSLTSPATELSQIARAIRTSLDTITTSRVHSAYALASCIPDYNQLTFPFATFDGAELCATSLLNLPLFELNFGKAFGNGGRPESVRPPREEFDVICRRCMVLPLRIYGGFEILITLAKEEMHRLMVDAEFANLFAISLFLYKLNSFIKNVQLAKGTSLPYTYSPLHELEVWAYVTDPLLRWTYSTYLMKGQGWPRWARFMVKDWMYEDKGRAHKQFGDVFLVVAPGGIVCYIANAKSAMNMCSRRKDFIKPPEKMRMLEPFGPNVVSVEGDLWRFHIRITLPSFGDAVNRLVWSETFRQTKLLASAWASNGSGDLKTDVYSLTVNVMSCAGFGQQADWTDENAIPTGHSMSLVSSIHGVVTYLPHILLLPKWLLKRSPWKKAHQSYAEYGRYIGEFLAAEKKKLSMNSNNESAMQGNLLTAILKSSNSNLAEKGDSRGSYHGRTTFADEEILGNTFIFLLAGYDTTANTIIFSAITLALNENIHNRIVKEIDQVYQEAEKDGRKELSYSQDLPRFRYLLAFMNLPVGMGSQYEIMRVYPIVIPIGRITTRQQELMIENDTPSGKGISYSKLPAHCGVIVNNTGIHHSHKYWPHPQIIEPLRWLSRSPNTFDPTSSSPPSCDDASNTTFTFPSHTKGTFLTFSEGPRACLGKRFAQVEFIAFFAGLLRQYRVCLGGKVAAEDVERVMRLRSGGSPVTLVPPEDVKLHLTPRR